MLSRFGRALDKVEQYSGSSMTYAIVALAFAILYLADKIYDGLVYKK